MNFKEKQEEIKNLLNDKGIILQNHGSHYRLHKVGTRFFSIWYSYKTLIKNINNIDWIKKTW